MAETIYLKDGSKEVIFYEQKAEDVLSDIIERKLGDDCLRLFNDILKSRKESLDNYQQELRSYEGSLDSYRAAMFEVIYSMDKILDYLSNAKVVRKNKIREIIDHSKTTLYNEL